MPRRIQLILASLLTSMPCLAQIPADITLEPAFGGATFDRPVAVRHAGDGSGRRFVVELDGEIRIVTADDNEENDPFLDVDALTITQGEPGAGNEQGLLGLAFHPNYADNGLLYINHSADNLSGIADGDTVVAEYQVDSINPNQVDLSSRRPIIVIPQDFNNHNGGDLHFGADGYLYIGMGDGGSGNDPCNRGQILDPSTTPGGSCRSGEAAWLLGKMIRIDVDNTTPAGSNNLCASNPDGSAAYAIPGDNPFVGLNDRCGEVWGYGLRNPYRFSFDRDTGDLWIGDVGQSTWEEVTLLAFGAPAGANFGWKVCEANWLRGSTSQSCSLSEAVGPVIEYRRLGSNCSVTGGFRYRGPVLSMQGYYVFSDYCAGDIRFASPDARGANWTVEVFGPTFGNPSGFGEDEQGNLYVTLLGGQILVFEGDTAPGDPLFDDRFEGPTD
ncbi:MAG: glucose dehydrogenase [Gammaproteobacteria bacterium]|jgi:glucose/arabinose dehydrogenase|nr:glucose dehydrogenase [Gammaproteobacteria bacterium]